MALNKYRETEKSKVKAKLQRIITLMGNGLMDFSFFNQCNTKQDYFYDGRHYKSENDIYKKECKKLFYLFTKSKKGVRKWKRDIADFVNLEKTKFPRSSHYKNPIRDIYAEITRRYFCIDYFNTKEKMSLLYQDDEQNEKAWLIDNADEYEALMKAFKQLRPGLLDLIDQHKTAGKSGDKKINTYFETQEVRRAKALERYFKKNPNIEDNAENKESYLKELRSKRKAQSLFADFDVLLGEKGERDKNLYFNIDEDKNRKLKVLIPKMKKIINYANHLSDSDPDKK